MKHADTELQLDANIFYNLETWIANPVAPYTTLYLSEIQVFQRHLTTAAFKIAGGVDIPTSTNPSRPIKQYSIASDFLSKITRAFLDSIYAFLDGLVHLTSDEAPMSIGKKFSLVDVSTMTGTNPLELLDLSEKVRSCEFVFHCALELTNLQDNRILLVVSNFNHISSVLLPSMIAELEIAFNVTMTNDRTVGPTQPYSAAFLNDFFDKAVMNTLQELDKNLFDRFIKPKSRVITGLVRSGILSSQMDWYETPQPKGMSHHMPSPMGKH